MAAKTTERPARHVVGRHWFSTGARKEAREAERVRDARIEALELARLRRTEER